MISLQGRCCLSLVGLGPFFALGLHWVGLGWVSQMIGRVGSSDRKWTHRQLWPACLSEQKQILKSEITITL